MPKSKYHFCLSDSERDHLKEIIDNSSTPERVILRANILLLLDNEERSQQKKTVLELAEELGTTHTTIQTVKNEFSERGLDAALVRKKRSVTKVNKRINDSAINQIIELASQQPPIDAKRWSIRMLCRECVERGIVSHIAPSTMQAILSNANIDLRKQSV